MILICKEPFGTLKPGDTVEVPDNVVFDTAYFGKKPATPAKGKGTKE